MRHQHIRIAREEPTNDRKPRRGPIPKIPTDPRGHGQRLQDSLSAALESDTSIGGYDDRKLLKLKLGATAGLRPEDLSAIPGVEVISQEEKEIILAFADAQGLAEFERRLTMLARDGTVTRKEILFALQAFEHWTAIDRTGKALATMEFPALGILLVDVELWPLAKPAERALLLVKFREWRTQEGIVELDLLNKPSLLMSRLRVTKAQLGRILEHRDVRLVDLPPSFGLETELLTFDVNRLPDVPPPPDGAALVGVLDSGLNSGHPLLAPAVGEAGGFVPPLRESSDESGHGTLVGGLALYGDVRTSLQRGQFIPQLRLLSGRVFNDDGQDQTRFVEKNVEDAVRYFHDEYRCRVYCFSYGDRNKVYDGRHIRGFAYTLDTLSRELGVLFVVPTGNLSSLPDDPANKYPSYLLQPESRMLDPAPALAALTVGGLADFEADVNAQRYPDTIESLAIAKSGEPSPFTRSGFSVNGAIKPDLAEVAGNYAVDRAGNLGSRRLGVLSLSKDFATGGAFREAVGTSFAAPQVAHAAARLLNHIPQASGNLLRAILATQARWPDAASALMTTNGKLDCDALLRLCGYGRVRHDALFESLDNAVTLFAEDTLVDDHHHFYEIPLPPDLWSPGRRTREITVSLAYSPDVRTTRIDYRATQVQFQLVQKSSLQEVSAWFRRQREDDAEQTGEYGNGRNISSARRNRGTLQSATWRFKAPRSADVFKLFLVVTRHDSNWSDVKATPEPYALSISIQDRENASARLYQQIQQQLQAREQARIGVRARVGH